MKLLVSWMSDLGRYVSREFFYTMQDLTRTHGWRQIEPWVLTQHTASPKSKLVEMLGGVPEVILFWETYDLVNAIMPALREMGCRVTLFADDLHVFRGKESMRDAKLRAFAACDDLLTPYAYVLHRFYPELRGQRTAAWVPHAASPDFHLPFNEEPENAILLSGFVGPLYPMRMQMKELQEAGGWAIVRHEHPGYGESFEYGKDDRVGAGYARTIHRFRAAFTDSGSYCYIVAKHFEIPATGALLMADGIVSEQLRELGFVEDVHYLPVRAENLEQTLTYVLDASNSAEIDQIRRQGQELALTAHTTSHRAKLIDKVCSI